MISSPQSYGLLARFILMCACIHLKPYMFIMPALRDVLSDLPPCKMSTDKVTPHIAKFLKINCNKTESHETLFYSTDPICNK